MATWRGRASTSNTSDTIIIEKKTITNKMSPIKNYGCCVVCQNWNHTFTLHRFPSDSKTRRLWLEKVGLQEKELKYSVKLCSVHFKVSCFIGTQKKRLAPGSIPTKFPPGRSNKKFTSPSTFKRLKNDHTKIWLCKMCNRFVKTKENVWTHLTMCNISNPHFDSKRVLSKDKDLKQEGEFVFVSSQYPEAQICNYCNAFILKKSSVNKHICNM